MSDQPQRLHEGRDYPSPFTKVLAWGYYDGPTHGVVVSEESGEVFKFDILTWDTSTQDLRVFSLSPLPGDALTRLTALYERFWKPLWPMWCPMWHFANESDQQEAERLSDEVRNEAGPEKWVIATTDLLGEIRVAKAITPEMITQISDWASFLGLPEHADLLPARPEL